jgi:PPIC-type PPIASE domain
MMRGFRSAAVLLASIAACGGPGTRERSKAGGALVQGVVANVDGTAITLAEVERLAARGGLTPKAALERLEAEVLLEREAERRGYANLSEVELVGRQAKVQALLATYVESERATAADVDEAYAQSQERFHTPERRVATHVLAVMPKKPAPDLDATERAYIADVIARLKAASDPAQVLDAIRSEKQPFGVSVEELRPAPREGQFVKEFSDALFSLDAPGIVPDPVRTQFGWHAIWVREILPEEHVPETVAREQLSREIQLNKRRARVEALLKQRQDRTGVTYAPNVRDALATLEY